MRARHPDLFSDSTTEIAPKVSKEVFEYHLDTLTSRKQEYEFEHFCRKLPHSPTTRSQRFCRHLCLIAMSQRRSWKTSADH